VLDKYQAGIIATSDGNGIKLDSIVIIANIQAYPNWSTFSTIKVANSANIIQQLKNNFRNYIKKLFYY
jgi:hypothetical protein